MTAVTQTEAFVKLDEGTVKDFITKVLRYFHHYTLPTPGCTKWSLQVVMMARVAAWLKIEIARWKGQERFFQKECITRVPRARSTSSPPHGLLPIQLSCDRQIEVSFLITLLFPLCHLCTIDVMNKPIMNVNPIYPEGIWMFCPNPPISQWESHCYCNIVATRKTQ